MADSSYYVYEHWRPDKGECFYVGKGKGRRAYLMASRNEWHKRIQRKLEKFKVDVEVRFIWENLTEKESLAMEKLRIKYWRKNGSKLVNITDGGEGVSGTKHTDEWKAEQSNRNIERWKSESARKKQSEKLKGRIISESARKAVSLSKKGKKNTEASKEKVSQTLKEKLNSESFKKTDGYRKMMDALKRGIENSKKKVICLNDGKIFQSMVEASKAYNVNQTHISANCRGKVKMAKGLTFQYYIEES